MRVALLGPGGSSHIVKWVNSLSERGLEVHLITAHKPSSEISAKVKIHRMRLWAKLGYFRGGELRRILEKIKPDLLNVHSASGYGQLARLSRFHPVLLSVWGSDVYEFPENGCVQRHILVENLRYADRIASTSHAMKRRVLHLCPEARVSVTPFGIDETRFTPISTRRPEDRPIVIGTVKTLESKYAIDVLIRSFAAVYTSLVQVEPAWAKRLKLLIVGDGNQRRSLRKLAHELGINSATEFRGYVPSASVPECLNEMDVFVALSRRESFGVAILEAGAAGLPVLVSDADGPAEVTVHDVTGFVVRRDDVTATAEKLKVLVLDPQLRARMGAAGRENVLRKYTWSESVNIMIDEYRNLLQAHARFESRMKRVLVLADGASIHTQRWLEGLGQSGPWALYLLSMNPAPVRDEIRSIPSLKGIFQVAPRQISESGNNYQYFFHLPAIWRKVREIHPSVISAVYLPSYGLVGALLRGSAKLIQFVVGDDIMIFPNQSRVRKWLTKFVLRRSVFVVSASSTMSDRMVNDFGYDSKAILTQQYGLADWVIDYPECGKDYDFISNRAWVGNSNLEFLLSVIRAMPKNKLALVGSTVPGSEALGARISALAGEIQGCEMLGSLSYKDNIGRVARSRFLVSLTLSDGASLSVMEAMALGTIPVLSDTAPNREWVKHGENGFLLPLEDEVEARARLEKAMRLSELERMKIISLNKAIIRERGSLSRNMARVSDRLLKLLDSANGPVHGFQSDEISEHP